MKRSLREPLRADGVRPIEHYPQELLGDAPGDSRPATTADPAWWS